MALSMAQRALGLFPTGVQQNLMLRGFSLFQVPMMGWCGPKIESLDDDTSVIRIALNFRTKNHLGAMYIGTLTVGADIAGGLLALHHTRESTAKVSVVFKDFAAQYHKRVEDDALFTCRDGLLVRDAVEQTLRTKERVHVPLRVVADVPTKLTQAAAEFQLTLSLKARSRQEA